jgi:pimeloyl-ACP methyl ester carboxylesterase
MMPSASSTPTRRSLLVAGAAGAAGASGAAGALMLGGPGFAGALPASAGPSIRPFQVHVPDSDLADLRRRVRATRWPPRETVDDESQGVPLARLQALVGYWGTGYDWRKVEARLNALPMFVTGIDGLDIQFIHVRSRHPQAMPLIITHGWPGSILELIKVIGPLTDPTAHGGRAEDAFHLVLPSMPGYGFSQRPTTNGWGPDRIGLAWDALMTRLGYQRYVAQGGDWGSVICDRMARQNLAGLMAIHVNMPATVPAEAARAMSAGDPAPAGLSDEERAAYDQLNTFFKKNGAYGAMMTTRPQTVGYGLSDSPAGLAAWMYDKFTQWTYSGGVAERSLTRDEMLDDISLYWLTNSAISSAQLYWENNANNFNAVNHALPTAVTIFPGEIYCAPRSWTERSYRNLIYFNQVDRGGHFAAWEEPDLFSREIRAAFRTLR